MVQRLVEGTQLIHIGPNTRLNLLQITYALQRAYASKLYAKFYTDKFFIQVNFMRDGNINVASNIQLPQFVSDLHYNNRMGWNITRAKTFVYKWMQNYRRILK